MCKDLFGRPYTTHSIRRSAAQWAARCGADDSTIKRAGRWSVLFFKSYLFSCDSLLFIQLTFIFHHDIVDHCLLSPKATNNQNLSIDQTENTKYAIKPGFLHDLIFINYDLQEIR